MNSGWRKNYIRYKTYFLDVTGRYQERSDIRVYLEILLSLVTVSVFSVFALRPTLLTIAELIREIQAKKTTLATMEEKILNLSRANSLYNEKIGEIELLKSSIPDKGVPEVFARQIEGLSEKHQIPIAEITTGRANILGAKVDLGEKADKTKENLPLPASELKFTVKTQVTMDKYQQMEKFIEDFEKLRFPARIDLLKLSSINDPEGKKLVLLIEGRYAYYFEKGEE